MKGDPTRGGSASPPPSLRATWSVVAASVLLLLFARVPFMVHNPDWTVIGSEHCFFLTLPGIHADREAAEGDLPFWLVNPTQLKTMFHGGARWIAHCTRLGCALLGSRSLVVVKLVGTAHLAVFVALLAWALMRVYGRPMDRYQIAVPLVLVAVPPVFFLWLTLLPMGHYFETHTFHGLLLPFVVAVGRGRPGAAMAVYTGCLLGLALVYSFSNVVLLGLAMLLILLFVDRPRLHRAGFAVSIGVLAVVVFAVVGRPAEVATRLLNSALLAPGTRDAAGLGAGSLFPQLVPTLQDHVTLLFGPHDDGILLRHSPGLWITLAITALAVAAAAVLLARTARTLAALRRRRPDSREIFVAAHGLSLLLFVVAYLAFDPYTRSRGNLTFIYYLAPVFPALFVGGGAMLSTLAHRRSAWGRRAAAATAGLGGLCLLLACAASYTQNARALQRPDAGACDCRYLYGYFLDEPTGAEVGPLWAGVAVVNRDEGQRRCELAFPDSGDACALVGYGMAAMQDAAPETCLAEPGYRARTCARAFGAVHHGCGMDEIGSACEICDTFEGALKGACVSGAHQAIHPDVPACPSLWEFLDRCTATFDSAPQRSACFEGVAALLYGAPELPSAPEALSPACVAWPEPWAGLCHEAAVAPDHLGEAASSCEGVYTEHYRDVIPPWSTISFDQCLTEAADFYRYCAVGVARAAGKTDCAWGGSL